ncbi:hypothetical protein [Reichenbachiella sp.]|uniref:hypothetical protein n=1 Tax=Reichenbachiella sp. TaxID=2184521 RepID=UPI003BB0097E
MKNSNLRFVFLLLSLAISITATGQYAMTETGITITFDGVNASVTNPLESGAGTLGQLDSDLWAIDLDDDNDFDMGGDNTGGFGSNFAEGENFTADNGDWSDHGSAEAFFSYNYDFGGINSNFPAIGMAVSGNSTFNNQDNSLITKIENTSSLEYTDLELSLDAYYYYVYFGWYGVPGLFNLGIHYHISATDITTDLSSATWTEITTLSKNNETTDGWKQYPGTDLEINGISIDPGEYLYLKFTFSPNGEAANPDPALAIDNIAVTPVGFGGTDATTSLTIDESASTTTLDPLANAAEVFRFDIVDDGASDGYPTTFSELIIEEGTSDGINDWTDLFETVTLTDETGGGSTTATIGTNTLTFSGLNYASATDMGFVTDGASKTYSLTIDFVDTYTGSQTIDNELLQFLVKSENIEIEGVSSTFLTANQIETSSSNNAMDVTASLLELQDEPSVVGTGSTSDVYFGLTILTKDAAGHLDEDVSSTLTITEATQTLQSGSLTFTAGSSTVNFAAGIYTFTDLYFDTSGGYTISFSSGAGYTGTNFAITAATSWRSAADGDWGNSSGTVWEYFIDGAGWTTAATNENPNATAANVGPIYINNTVAIETTGYNSDQLYINSGGVLDVNNTFTINEDGTSLEDLTIEDGGTLDVEAAITITGTFLVKEGSSIAGGGIITSGTADYIVDFGESTNGYWETYSVLRYTADATIALTANTTFFPNASSSQYPLFEITAIRYKDLSNGGFTHTINGIVYYTDPDRMDLGTNNYILRNGMISEPGSDLQYENITSMPGDTLFFSGNLYSGGGEIDVDISSSAPSVIQLLGDVTSSSNDRLNFDVQSSGTLVLGDYDCDFGDFTFQSGSTIKVSNTQGFGADQFAGADALVINNGTIFHFNGTAAQATGFGTLDGGTTSVADIVVDNSAGLTLDSDITLTNGLTFEEGIFTAQPSAPGVLSVSSTISFTGQSSSAHIQGPVSIASYSSSKFIPIGANDAGTDYYRPLIAYPASSMTVIAEYTRSDPNAISGTFDTDGTHNPQALTTSGYYTITFGSTGTADIALYFDESADAIAGSDDLVIAKYDVSAGEWIGYESVSYSTDYILATVTIDDLADVNFTIASVTGSLLPVELIQFTAETNSQKVYLNWITASELNNDRFEIEHSVNGVDFDLIGQVSGFGTTNERQTYSFTHHNPSLYANYYRLKQVDYDGAYEYSTTVAVNLAFNERSLQILGNPISEGKLKFTFTDSSDPIVKVLNLSGRKVEGIAKHSSGSRFEINVSHLLPGVYMLFVNEEVQRFIVF